MFSDATIIKPAGQLKSQINSKLSKLQSDLKLDLSKPWSWSCFLEAAKDASSNIKGNKQVETQQEQPGRQKSRRFGLRRSNSSKVGEKSRSSRQTLFVGRENEQEEPAVEWAPTLRRSLQRSLSLNQSPANRAPTKRTSTRLKFTANLGRRLEAWMAGAHKSWLAIFVGLLVVASTLATGASIPASYLKSAAKPIWLGDSLMTLDTSTIDSDSRSNSPEEIHLWPRADNLDGQKVQEIEPLVNAPLDSQLEAESRLLTSPEREELLWVQRRRLNRDRALEPAPWLREQPMRRGYNPALLVEPNEEPNDNFAEVAGQIRQQDEDADRNKWLETRSARGRHSRQSAEQIYDDIVKYLVEEALENQALIEELYEELELRAKPNQRPNLIQQSGLIVQPVMQQQRKQKSNSEQEGIVLSRQDQLGSQEMDPYATLVVASDDVSSNDDVTPLEVSGRLRAADVQGTGQESAGDLLASDSQGNLAEVDPFKAVALTETGSSGQANGVGELPAPQQIVAEEPQQASSFHVLEDIDREEASEQPVALTNGQEERESDRRQLVGKRAFARGQTPDWLLAKRATLLEGQIRLFPVNSERLMRLPEAELSYTGANLDSSDLPIGMIESPHLNRRQLVAAATILRANLEDQIGLPRASILGLYPLDADQLLVKLDVGRLSAHLINNLTRDFDFARSFLVVRWPPGSPSSPVPLLAAVLRALASSSPSQADESKVELAESESQQLANLEPAESAHWRPAPVERARGPLLLLAAYLNSVSQPDWPSEELALPLVAGAPLRAAPDDNAESQPAGSSHLFQWAAIGFAMVCALVAVKLVAYGASDERLRRKFRREGSLRSLWSSKSGSVEQELGGGERRRSEEESKVSGESTASYSQDGDSARKHVDLLVQRLLSILSRGEKKEQVGKLAAEPDEAAREEKSQFRSSRSYIRSLVEVLGRARAQIPGGSRTATVVAQEELKVGEGSGDCSPTSDHQQDFLSAQMDISAAHLILSYMEKHLEDKERLRREWLELEAQSRPKITQLALEQLAKVALAKENRAKNRNPLVVPFDRNRVKLAGKCACKSSSDYINASFIHDDDSRRPTHIVAQGPSEQTSAAFWQMIWEQGISVLVMLTRLNENGSKQCHCYWPAANQANEERTNEEPAARQSATGASRRGSVTSVYSQPGGRNGNGHIVANGELANNVLAFEFADCGCQEERRRLEVHLVSEHVSSGDFLVRNLYLINRSSGETRTIAQFHYLSWPDAGVPADVRSLLHFRRKVHKSYRDLKNPILVHCSDGGGRSGTYTLIDTILERLQNGAKEIDPRATLEHLRDQRAGLCASQSQFEFVLVALAEEIQLVVNALPQ